MNNNFDINEIAKITQEENDRLKDENMRLKSLLSKRILLVEDGSVNIEQLEEDGFYVIPYRQGANKPEFLE